MIKEECCMKKNITIILAITCLSMFVFTIKPVVGLLPTSLVGNINRPINTDLHFAFANGSYFMYNQSTSESIYGASSDSPTPLNASASDWEYSLQRVTYQYINNVTTNITISNYNNVTNNPSIPFDLTNWEYDSNQTISINNTLIGILGGMGYFPEDVNIADIMYSDTALRQVLLSEILGGMSIIGDIWNVIDSLQTHNNVTIYGGIQNSTAVDLTNNYNGSYHSNITANVHINDLTDMDLDNCDLNLTLAVYTAGVMTCQHTVKYNSEGIRAIASITNSTNQSQYIHIDFSVGLLRAVIWSSLPECPAGYENPSIISGGISWYWWLLVICVVTVGATIGIMYMVQRSKCDDIVGVITKGDRKLTKEELAKLPMACHNGKYLK